MNPTLMDPIDHRNVFVGESGLPGTGQGLFARRDIAPHELVVVYAGTLVLSTDDRAANMSVDEREVYYKNLMSYDDNYSLNVPPEMFNVADYRATLGHKVTDYTSLKISKQI